MAGFKLEEGGEAPAQYSLTTNVVGNGSITRMPDQTTYNAGTVVTLTAVPNTGYSFTSWGGDLGGSTNPTTITMDGNKTVSAAFDPDTTPPVAPVDLAATGGEALIDLSWTANSESDLAGYNVYRSVTTPVVLTNPINGGTLVTSTSYQDIGLLPNTTYYYVVTAEDAAGNESPASNEANATTDTSTTVSFQEGVGGYTGTVDTSS